MAHTTGTTHRLLERLQQGDALVSEELHLPMTPGTEMVLLLCTDVVGPNEEIRWIGNRPMNTIEHHDTHVGMIFLDLGQFRAINDRFGHLAGDAVLSEVARRLEAGLRKADVVARVRGDQFLILLPDATGLGDVGTVAHRLEHEMLTPIAVRETKISVRPEMGIALVPDHGSFLEELVRASDRAMMYRARKNWSELADRPVSVLAAESTSDPNRAVEDLASQSGRGAGPSQAM